MALSSVQVRTLFHISCSNLNQKQIKLLVTAERTCIKEFHFRCHTHSVQTYPARLSQREISYLPFCTSSPPLPFLSLSFLSPPPTPSSSLSCGKEGEAFKEAFVQIAPGAAPSPLHLLPQMDTRPATKGVLRSEKGEGDPRERERERANHPCLNLTAVSPTLLSGGTI